MKQLGNKQWHRKTESLLALLMYRKAQGAVETEPFATLMQQIFSDVIAANPVDANVLKNSMAQFKLGKLPKTKRTRRRFAYSWKLYQQTKKNGEQPPDPPLIIGDLINIWAELTDQDKAEFATRVCPKIKKLLAKQYKATGHIGFTDSQTNENPESAFDFMANLFNILVEETPEDKKDCLTEKIKNNLPALNTQPMSENANELLHDVSTMFTSEIVTQINGALCDNPSAKDRLLHPLVGEVIAMEAEKYGWDSGVPADNHARLQSAISQNGVSLNKRMTSRSLRRLGRKSTLQNISDAVDGNLMQNLNAIISEQTTSEQNKSQTIWEPSSGDTAESEKGVREWLFRRDKNGTSRNH